MTHKNLILMSCLFLMATPHQVLAATAVDAIYPDKITDPASDYDMNPNREALRRPHYNLLVTNAERNGSFTIDNSLTVLDSRGKKLINVRNADPVFFARLPPGDYTIIATNGDRQKVRKISISARKQTSLDLAW